MTTVRHRPVFLLHGLGRNPSSMWILRFHLRRAGLDAQTIGYPSTRLDLDGNVDFVRSELSQCSGAEPIDLVGHSLGGVIARRLGLEDGHPEIGNIVQIGAPNLGSALADRMGPFWAIRRACGPTIADLGKTSTPLPTLTNVTAIAGVIASGKDSATLRGPHDGAVTVRSAWAGAKHRHIVRQAHTLLPTSAAVARFTIAALRPTAHRHHA
ncbi:MAG: hypothetical protein AAFN27_06490 [Pseudomonadota bacterium]